MAESTKDFRVVWDALKSFETCADIASLKAVILSSLARYGYEHISVISAETKINKKSGPDRTLLSSWPAAWFERYHDQGFGAHDPVALMSRKALRTFRWCEAKASSSQGRLIMDAAREDHRFRYGLCVPIRNFEGYYAAASFAGEDVDESEAGRFFGELLAIYAFNRLSTFGKSIAPVFALTDRQREIMQWVAVGKSAWDVSVILSISINTVNKTIANAMERLDVRTRAQAIAEAIRRGEITP